MNNKLTAFFIVAAVLIATTFCGPISDMQAKHGNYACVRMKNNWCRCVSTLGEAGYAFAAPCDVLDDNCEVVK